MRVLQDNGGTGKGQNPGTNVGIEVLTDNNGAIILDHAERLPARNRDGLYK